jgi:hypothetical protein
MPCLEEECPAPETLTFVDAGWVNESLDPLQEVSSTKGRDYLDCLAGDWSREIGEKKFD